MRKRASFPHPVLGHLDDMSGSFAPRAAYTPGESFVIEVSGLEPVNAGIAELIHQKKARHTIKIECSRTFFRKTYCSFDPEAAIKIPENRLRDKVVISFRTTAVEEIPHYLPVGAHPDYDGAVFSLNPGDVLAAAPDQSFVADKDFDPLKPAVGSFIVVRCGVDEAGPFIVDLDEDRVVVVLSKRDFRHFENNRASCPAAVHASMIFPALTEALRAMTCYFDGGGSAALDSASDLTQYSWFQRLQAMLDHRRIVLKSDNFLEVGQRLLEDPIHRQFEELAHVLEAAE